MSDTNDLQFSELLDWLEGRLSEEEAHRVTQKLEKADDAVRADLEWMRGVLVISETARSISPPPKVRASLREQFRGFAQSKHPPSIFQRLLAALTFDSHTQFAVAGVRSATTEGKQRQLIYNTDLAEIALNIHVRPQDNQITLMGHIFPKGDFSPYGFTIQLLEMDGISEKALVTSDELGEFTIVSLSQGQYGIMITTEGYEIVLPNVPLQH